MAAELKIGIGADLSGLNKAIDEAKEKVISVTDVKVPKVTIPKIEIPKIEFPEVTIPEIKPPKVEIEVEKVVIPPISVPEIKVPEVEVPPIVVPPIPPIDAPDVPPIIIPPIDDKPIKDLKEKLKDLGESMSNVGQKMSVGLTLPIAGLATASLNAFKEIEGVRVAFDRLNDPSLLDNLRKATKNTTSDLQLMQSAVSAEKFGLSVSALPKLLEYARRVAKDTGQSVDYLVDSIVTGIGRKSPLILDNLGISATSLKEALGGVTMETASVAQVTEAVAKIAEQELKKMGADANTLSESWAKIGTVISNSLGKIGKIINDTFDISGIIDKLTGYLDTAISYFEGLSPAIQKTILVVTGLVAAAGPLLVVVGGFIAALPTIITGLGALKVGFLALTGPIGLVTAAVIGVVAAFIANWSKIKPYIVNTINYFRDLYNESIVVRGAVVGLSTIFKIAFSAISNTLKTAWEVFKTFAKATADLFGGVGKVLKGALTGDLDGIKAGLGQMAIAWNSGLTSLGKDIAGGIKAFHNDVKKHFSDGLNDIVSGGKLKPISDIKIFDEEKIAEKTKNAVTNGVEKGIKKAKDKLKDIKIELPDLEVLAPKGGFNFINNLGEQFSSIEDLLARNDRLSESIKLSLGGIPIALSESEIAINEAGLRFEEAINGLISEGLIEGLTNAFNAMGEAMFNGSNILAAAGGAILSTLGQFLQMLGKEMIKLALTTVVLGNLVAGIKKFIIANPGAAIALAAIALAAGAALSAAGSNIGKGGGGSGGSVPSGGTRSQSYSSSFSGGGAGGGEVVFRISGNDLVGVLSRQQDKNSRLGG